MELLNEKKHIICIESCHIYKVQWILPSIKAGTTANTKDMGSNMLKRS